MVFLAEVENLVVVVVAPYSSVVLMLGFVAGVALGPTTLVDPAPLPVLQEVMADDSLVQVDAGNFVANLVQGERLDLKDVVLLQELGEVVEVVH